MQLPHTDVRFRVSGLLYRVHDWIFYGNAASAGRRARASTLLVAAIVLVIAAIDSVTSNLNLAPLYAVPLVLFARHATRRQLIAFSLLLIALTYIGYFSVGPRVAPRIGFLYVDDILNRTVCAMTMLFLAVYSNWWAGPRHGGSAALDAGDAMPSALQDLTAWPISALLLLALAIFDFTSPQNYNLAILYMIPLLISAAARARAVLWAEVALIVVLAWVDYRWGTGPTAGARSSIWAACDRMIAVAGILALAALANRNLIAPAASPRAAMV